MAGSSICLKHCAKRGKKTRPRVDQKMRPQSYPEIARVNRSHRVSQSSPELLRFRVTESHPELPSLQELLRVAQTCIRVGGSGGGGIGSGRGSGILFPRMILSSKIQLSMLLIAH